MYRHDGRSSRSGTPRASMPPPGAGMYPTYDTPNDADSEYEERGLATMYAGAANAVVDGGVDYRAAGPTSPYGAAPQYQSAYAHVPPYHSGYGSPRPASSAPTAYNPYGEQDYRYNQAGGSVPGAFPATLSEPGPAPGDYFWYAGESGSAPSVVPSAYSAPEYSRQSYAGPPPPPLSRHGTPGFFGVRAPHHHPGHRYSAPSAHRGDERLPDFPQWSRTWYDGHLSANGHAYTTVAPPSGASGWEAETMSRSGGPPSGAYGHVYGSPRNMADVVKEERIRMLEKQFGKPKVSHKNGDDDEDGEDEGARADDAELDDAELPYGCVNSRGKLVTERPKWKTALRWLISLGAIASCATGLGGALLIKPGSTDVPAARGSTASYVLYGCSVVTLVVVLYLYVFRPLCCDPIRKDIKSGGGGGGAENPLAGMIIPVLSGGNASGKPKRGMFGKKRGMMQQPSPTVNLIVDPALLGIAGGRGGGQRGKRGGRDDEDDESDDERLPGDARRSSRRKNGVGVLGNMLMQRRWQMARKTLKLETTWDAVLLVAWIACIVVALGFGKSCPPGAGNGWCNYYNGAIACGAILAALLLVVLYFDYRDLSVSKRPPKPPM